MFERLGRWLSGNFECIKCGKQYQLLTLGCGKVVCPDCYNGEQPFIFLDTSFWLNRILARFLKPIKPKTELSSIDDLILDQMSILSEKELSN